MRNLNLVICVLALATVLEPSQAKDLQTQWTTANGVCKPVQLESPSSMVVDSQGRLIVASGGGSHVLDVFSPSGIQTILLTRGGGTVADFVNPVIAAEPNGSLILATEDHARLSRISAEGKVTPLNMTGEYMIHPKLITSLAVDRVGELFFIEGQALGKVDAHGHASLLLAGC